MVQTRSQKKIIDNFYNLNNMEKNAVKILIELSEMETKKNNILDNYSEEDINNFKLEIARKQCKDTLSKYDVVIPDLVKYCPYNGSYETQIKEAFKRKNMETYTALIVYKNKMEQYDNVNNNLKNNFNNILNGITDNDILNYINDNKDTGNSRETIIILNKKKEELQKLKEIKHFKELIEVKKLIKNELDNEIIDLENKYNILMENFKKEYV